MTNFFLRHDVFSVNGCFIDSIGVAVCVYAPASMYISATS